MKNTANETVGGQQSKVRNHDSNSK